MLALLFSVMVAAPVLEEHKFQTDFRLGARTHQTNLFCGGLQAGKTIAGADAVHELLYEVCLDVPPQAKAFYPEVWILSRSYVLVDAAWDTYVARHGETVIPPDQCRKYGLSLKGNVHWLYPNAPGRKPIRVRLRTTDDPENLRATPNVILAWGDEIAHWKELSVKNLLGRSVVTRTVYIFTTTPKGKNWLYRDIYVPGTNGTDKTVHVVTCRSVDNPWADPEYLAKLRLKFGPAYADQELDALFTANVGYVYDFDRTVHMKAPPYDEPSQYKSRVIGLDPGYGDPYAAGVWLKDWDDNWWLADEVYLPSKAVVDDVVPWISAHVKRWKIEAVYVDKRRPTDWNLLRRKGIRALPNVDVFGEDDRRTVMPMIRMVQRLFREGRIHIAPHCEWHAEEFENYSFREAEEKNAGENPVDFKNHAMDAMRYAICSVDALPEDRRLRVRTGPNLVPTPVGARKLRPGEKPYRFLSPAEIINAMDKKMDEQAKGYGRRG